MATNPVWNLFTQAALATMQGLINWTDPNIHCALMSSAYVPNVATDATWSGVGGINGNEITGTGYTAGGVAVTAPTVTVAAGIVTAAGTISGWTGSMAAHYAVLYNSSTNRVMAFNDLTVGTVGGTLLACTNGALNVYAYGATLAHTP